MALNVSLTTLIGTVRQRSNMENNQFVTDAEITTMINGSGAELHQLITEAYEDYYLKEVNFNASTSNVPFSWIATLVNSGPPGSVPTGFSPAIIGTPVTFVSTGNTGIIRNVIITTKNGTLVYQVDISDLSFTPGGSNNPQSGEYIEDTATGGSVCNGQFNFSNGGIGAGDFFKAAGVSFLIGGSTEIPLKNYQLNERGKYQNNPFISSYYGRICKYRVGPTSLIFAPNPSGGQAAKLYYYAAYTPLINFTDTLDCVDGFEEYIILDVCSKIMNKQELDASQYDNKKQMYLTKIENAKINRDINAPRRIVSTSEDEMPYVIGGWR